MTVFDDDLFDAEVIVDRRGGNEFTAIDLGLLLGAPTEGSARMRVVRLLSAGVIPRPAHPGGNVEPDRWTKDQVVRIVAASRQS